MANYWFNALLAAAAQTKPYKRRLAYLESSGTQYIDTGVIFDPQLDMDVTATVAAIDDNRAVLIGSYRDNTSCLNIEWGTGTNARKLRGYIQVPSVLNVWSGTAQAVDTPTEINFAYFAASHSATLTVGGDSFSATAQYSPGEASANSMRLFLDQRSSTSSIAHGTRIHSLAIKRNGMTLRDFIPVLDWNDVPCMYDTISDTRFYNGGTGTFNYGELS